MPINSAAVAVGTSTASTIAAVDPASAGFVEYRIVNNGASGILWVGGLTSGTVSSLPGSVPLAINGGAISVVLGAGDAVYGIATVATVDARVVSAAAISGFRRFA